MYLAYLWVLLPVPAGGWKRDHRYSSWISTNSGFVRKNRSDCSVEQYFICSLLVPCENFDNPRVTEWIFRPQSLPPLTTPNQMISKPKVSQHNHRARRILLFPPTSYSDTINWKQWPTTPNVPKLLHPPWYVPSEIDGSFKNRSQKKEAIMECWILDPRSERCHRLFLRLSAPVEIYFLVFLIFFCLLFYFILF